MYPSKLVSEGKKATSGLNASWVETGMHGD
jgi:hypothetical protein